MASALFEDTIAAVATAPGRGAIALVRVSGPAALEVARGVCRALPVPAEPRRAYLQPLFHPESNELLDRGLVTFFPGPGSYTGEDSVEIATHGGPLTPQLVLDALLAAGARTAEPGEFTRRAVYHGRIDVLQAEAIGDLIDGRSVAFHRAALNQMEGGLSRRIEELRAAILRVEGLVAYGIDFPEEDEPPVPPAAIVAAAANVTASIDRLLGTADQGELLRDGALVVLAGLPNSGKSSLFNALLGAERALVTDVPGTTRDAIEASVTLDGYPFRLVDTAGLRETADVVEGMGIEVARRYLRAADIVIFCSEASDPLTAEEREFVAAADPTRTVLALTKADLPGSRAAAPDPDHKVPVVLTSSTSGAGFDDLREALLGIAFGGIIDEPADQPIVVRARNARALRTARAEVETFVHSFHSQVPPEFSATHLRAAAHSLEQLIGAVTPDDVLSEIFGSFCVGK